MGRACFKLSLCSTICVLLAGIAFGQSYEEARSPAWRIFEIVLYLGTILFIGYVLYQLTVATLEAVAKLIAAIIGLIVSAVSWAIFAIAFLLWLVAAGATTCAAVIVTALWALLWPPAKERLRLLYRAVFKPADHLPLLFDIRMKGDKFFEPNKEPETLKTVIESYNRLTSLAEQLQADENCANTGQILSDYLEAVRQLCHNLEICELHVIDYPEAPEFIPPSPTHALTDFRATYRRLFENPAMAFKFLFLYPFRPIGWVLTSPFIFAFQTAKLIISWIHLGAAEESNERIGQMKKLLSQHQRDIEQVIKDFANFQSEQQSVHQQTKAIRDELAAELEAVRKMAEQYHNEAHRLRDYVGLVKARSDEMDKVDPLAEMKELLAEVRKSSPVGASSV